MNTQFLSSCALLKLTYAILRRQSEDIDSCFIPHGCTNPQHCPNTTKRRTYFHTRDTYCQHHL